LDPGWTPFQRPARSAGWTDWADRTPVKNGLGATFSPAGNFLQSSQFDLTDNLDAVRAIRRPAARGGGHNLRINGVLLAIVGIVGCSFWAPDGRGQNAPSALPGTPDANTARSAGNKETTEQELIRTARRLTELGQAQAQVKAGEGNEVDRLKAQLDLQQKQIDVLLNMTQLLADQAKKQPATGEAVQKLEEQAADHEARQTRSAQRDQELARVYDDLLEQVDASSRQTPFLPSTLRELFLPFRTNESPVALYGVVDENFYAFSQQNTSFSDPTLQLHPYVLTNERWLMSANIIVLSSGLQVCRAQAEWFINDYLTFVAGRFYSPIGFYTERLRLSWVLKTPDPPLMFNQVYPNQLFFDGLQLRGARYLFNSPIKAEYVGFVANGMSVAGGNLSPKVYSDLSNFLDTGLDVNGAKAYGGRIGISIPKLGFIAGVSGLLNQAYDSANHQISIWDVDVNWHRGNWDARFELADTNQQTPSPAPPIHRFGYYAQVAYRQYNNPNPILQKLEGVFRFDHVQLDGINLQQTGINFGGYDYIYARMPLDRNRYTLGANYWFTPSLALKVAIEWYEELGVPSLRDNGFIGQLTWGW
jgi:hypothetical protein